MISYVPVRVQYVSCILYALRIRNAQPIAHMLQVEEAKDIRYPIGSM